MTVIFTNHQPNFTFSLYTGNVTYFNGSYIQKSVVSCKKVWKLILLHL